MQQRVLGPAGGEVDDRGETLRLPAAERLVGPHQRVFELRDVDLDRGARQVPPAIERGRIVVRDAVRRAMNRPPRRTMPRRPCCVHLNFTIDFLS